MNIFKYVTIVLICISLVAFLAYPTNQQKFTLERLLQVAENAPTGAYERVREDILSIEPPTIKRPSNMVGIKTGQVPTFIKVIDGINSMIGVLWFIGESTIFTGALLYDAMHILGYFIMELI